jgi:hypothetical protein
METMSRRGSAKNSRAAEKPEQPCLAAKEEARSAERLSADTRATPFDSTIARACISATSPVPTIPIP